MEKNTVHQRLLKELDRSLIVDEKTREYWLKNYKTLPQSAVQFFCDQLIKENDHIDFMIAVAIDSDPKLKEKILQKGKAAKRKIYSLLETQEREEESPEKFLKSNM